MSRHGRTVRTVSGLPETLLDGFYRVAILFQKLMPDSSVESYWGFLPRTRCTISQDKSSIVVGDEKHLAVSRAIAMRREELISEL